MYERNVRLILGRRKSGRDTLLPRQETKQETKPAATTSRPVGLTFAALFYAAAGIYYVAFPIAAQDLSMIQLYILGAVSIIGSFGIMRLYRWGLWLGLLLYPPHLIAPAAALFTAVSYTGVFQQPIAIAFVLSLIILMFFATLTFLLILDKRKSFN
jgi:hypothetical protein